MPTLQLSPIESAATVAINARQILYGAKEKFSFLLLIKKALPCVFHRSQTLYLGLHVPHLCVHACGISVEKTVFNVIVLFHVKETCNLTFHGSSAILIHESVQRGHFLKARRDRTYHQLSFLYGSFCRFCLYLLAIAMDLLDQAECASDETAYIDNSKVLIQRRN